MNMSFKEVMQRIGFHSLVLLRGFTKTLYGALTAGLIGLSVGGFAAIPSEGGYAAVCDFVAAIAMLTVALTCMYVFGCKRRKHR